MLFFSHFSILKAPWFNASRIVWPKHVLYRSFPKPNIVSSFSYTAQEAKVRLYPAAVGFDNWMGNMSKHRNMPGPGQRGCELVRSHGCLWWRGLYGKAQSRIWWYAMPSILFMNWELLSGVLTGNIVKTCQHSSVNVKGSWHVSTATFPLALPISFPEFIWWRGRECKQESRVKFLCAQTSKTITIFCTFWIGFPSFLWLSHMGTFILNSQSLWKEWACCCINTVVCALTGLLPHLHVYSLTVHSSWVSLTGVSAHTANKLMVSNDIKIGYKYRSIKVDFGMQTVLT